MGHATRRHSLLSPSGAHRWLRCTPSAMLERQFPDIPSKAAAEGTLAHELAEVKLRHYFETVDFGKAKYTRAVNKLKKEADWQDEMMGYTDEYLDYVKSTAMAFSSKPTVEIEKRVRLGAYVPSPPGEEETSGSADCILIGQGELHIIDFKYGKGVPVSAEGNPQLALYALGAYEEYKIFYRIEKIVLHIVQPRLSEISSWSCDLKELMAFGTYVKKQAALAVEGKGNYFPGKETCRFCRAKGRCGARADENVKLASDVGKKPPLITNEEMGHYLKQGQDVAKWLSDLQEIALSECLSGKEVPGWKAVEGRGSRDWTDMDQAFSRLINEGIREEILWERKPLTLAQVEKAVGKKDFQELVGDLVIKKAGKPALVEESDKREAITNQMTAAKAFGTSDLEKENEKDE